MKDTKGQALATLAGLIVGVPFVLFGGPDLLAAPLALAAGAAVGYLTDQKLGR